MPGIKREKAEELVKVAEKGKMGSMGLDRFAAQRSGLDGNGNAAQHSTAGKRACTWPVREHAQWQVGRLPGFRCNFLEWADPLCWKLEIVLVVAVP